MFNASWGDKAQKESHRLFSIYNHKRRAKKRLVKILHQQMTRWFFYGKYIAPLQ